MHDLRTIQILDWNKGILVSLVYTLAILLDRLTVLKHLGHGFVVSARSHQVELRTSSPRCTHWLSLEIAA
jgi:hypothetical protein